MAASADPTPSPDQIERLRAGDRDAFADLVREHGPRMLGQARRFLPGEHDAQDAVQDAFLSAFRAIGTFDGRAQLSTWLHRITINACLMKLRTRRRRPERSIESLLPTFLPDGHQTRSAREWSEDPVNGLDREQTDRQIREALDELPDAHRTVLMLRDIEGLSTEHAAEVLEISQDAVKTRLHRARQALRTLLEPLFTDNPGGASR
jgi:RNA polymerase sigma-70 factor (ECF subfamily)